MPVAALLLPLVTFAAQCPPSLLAAAGIGPKYNESIAHGIHSITLEGLRAFNPRVGPRNGVPTINRDMRSAVKVLDDAIEVALPESRFVTQPMQVINAVFESLGEQNFGLDGSWTPIMRVIHDFHMRDVWEKVRGVYEAKVVRTPPSAEVCDCLTDTRANGIRAAVTTCQTCQWVWDDKLPLPEPTDKATWKILRERITMYYDEQSLFEVATYLYCAVGRL